jgi:hypothetical protein
LTSGRIEGVPHGHIGILVSMMLVGFAADHQLIIRYRKVNPDMVQIAFVVVLMVGLNDHSASHSVVVELIKLFGFFPNVRFDRGRRVQITESDLQW